ncbi:MAG TPA: Tad domain-containing protein [Candidatus Limnocylindria bacterium]
MKSLQEFFGPKGEGGQAIVLIALMMIVMLMIVGLAVDGGQLYSAKRTQQEASDAAAFAGAVVIYQSPVSCWQAPPCAAARQAAFDDATRNGFTDGVNNTTVTVNHPPSSGPYAGLGKYVEVIIVRQVRTALVPAQSILNPVRAHGVAGADPIKSPFAIFLLKQTGPCLTTQGTGSIQVPAGVDLGGVIQSNCTGNPSWDMQGSGVVYNQLGDNSVRTVGAVSAPGRVTCSLPCTTPLQTGASIQPDPFAGFPRPPAEAVPFWSGPGQYNIPASACNPATPLQPHTYVGGLLNNNNCTVYLATGVYVLKGGGFTQNANSGTIATIGASQALGAMIFNTNSTYPTTGSTCGDISAQQGGGFDTWAMATGPYAGMALYQDRNCTNTIAIQSNGSYFFHGTLYAPTAALALTSQSGATLYSQLVVSELQMQSNGNMVVNYRPSESANTGLPTLVQ